jgi:hypothetical protein
VAYKFQVNQESLKRFFAVYVVLAKGQKDTKIYVGKTGDNRDGCNPVISRCGNHFSYNKGHSQIRNNIPDYEHREYTYIFDHFYEYNKDIKKRREAIDRINEMERWLNVEVQNVIGSKKNCELLNRFTASAYVTLPEQRKRLAFRTENEAKQKILGIIAEMRSELS